MQWRRELIADQPPCTDHTASLLDHANELFSSFNSYRSLKSRPRREVYERALAFLDKHLQAPAQKTN